MPGIQKGKKHKVTPKIKTAEGDITDLTEYQNKSIWTWPAFPTTTKPIKCTPARLLQGITDYANTRQTLLDVLGECGIDNATFWDLVRDHKEISAIYAAARRKKAEIYGAAAAQAYDDLPDDDIYYTYDKAGNKCLTNAAVSLLRDKANHMVRLAAIHETGTFVDQRKIDQRSMSLNVNATVEEAKELLNPTLDDLMGMQ
jgi:hypothetical protein